MSKRLREEVLKDIPTSGGMLNLFDMIGNSCKINIKIKNFMLITFMLLPTFFVYTQTYNIIDGNQTGQHAPIEPYWSWTYSQQIYYQSEINQEGNITGLSFEYNGNSSWTDQVEVYLGHTSKSSFTSDTDWISYSDLTLVYDGDYSVSTTAGWYSITFDTNFYYNNTDNLVIAVYEKTNGYHSVSDEFYTADGGVNRVLTYYDDYVNPDPTSPPTADYHQEWIPNLKLNISEAGTSLPIELISFTGNLNMDKSVSLYWVVASELNNDYYTIKHSMDGNNWDVIGIVYGVGNASQPLNYTFRHLEPKSGINYYRLKQTDFDGKFEKFGPIAIEVVREKQYIVAIYDLLGQPVNDDYKGVIILEWDNGEKEKVFIE